MNPDSLIYIFGRGLAPHTLTAYYWNFRRLIEWLDGRDLTDETLAAFLDSQNAAGKAPAAGALTLAAISASCREDSTPSPIGPKSKGALREWRRNSAGRGRGQAASVRWELADLLCAQAEKDGDLRGARDSALIAIMSDALLRGSEASALNAGDISLAPDGSGSLIVQRGKGQIESSTPLYLGHSTASRWTAWQQGGACFSGPAFRAIHRDGVRVGDRLGRNAISNIIKGRAAAAGLAGVSSHSLRIGSAGSLAAHGAGLPELQAAGRWQDTRMPGRYAGQELSRRSAIARLRYQQ